MTGDQVIALRLDWSRTTPYGGSLPAATVLASRDWLAYVDVMRASVPVTDIYVMPTEEEVSWAWPDGVAIVLEEPLYVEHVIVSKGVRGVAGIRTEATDPHTETQQVRGVSIGARVMADTTAPQGKPWEGQEAIPARPVFWIGEDRMDVVSAWWTPELTMVKSEGLESLSDSVRLLVSLLAALGHRLTRLSDVPVSGGRGERRRVARALPGLRLLELATGAVVKREDAEPGAVEWQRRWMVRGHWRLQPCGPRNENRKLRWIDPYVKGPEGLPLDVRPTIWKTPQPPERD